MNIQRLSVLLFGIAIGLTLAAATPALGQQPMLDVDEAINMTHSALDMDGMNTDLRLQLVKLYFVKGARDLEKGRDAAAINSLSEAQRISEVGGGIGMGGDDVMMYVAYAMAHASDRMGRTDETISILEGMAASTPDFYEARYMLGLILMRSSNEMDFDRGIETLHQLYRDAPFSMQAKTAHAGANLGYDRGMSEAAAGGTSTALSVMERVSNYFGDNPFNTAEQANHFNYVLGALYDGTGLTPGAIAQYETVQASDSAYVASGASIGAILGDAYYKRGLELLQQGDAQSAGEAIAMLDKSEELGGAAVDIHHGRLLAYAIMDDQGGQDRELAAIERMDRNYYNSILK